LAVLISRAALACRTGMATFAEAGVSDKPADDTAAPKAAADGGRVRRFMPLGWLPALRITRTDGRR
jgi:hypothetical protein